MAGWKGQSKGTVLGYKIFIFFIKNLGLNAAYALLVFVAAYYFLFSFESTRNAYVFYRKRLGFSILKSRINIYKNYFKLGQTLIDRVAISSGLRHKFTFEFDGVENIKNMLRAGKGGVMFTAHLGNINIAKYFFEEMDDGSVINMIVTDFEHREIKEYIDSVTKKSKLKFILIKEDMSHIFEINEALTSNEIIVFAADRHSEGTKYLTANFLGKPAKFYYGPYRIAARKNLPVVFAYIMKEPNLHYHFYARPCKKTNLETQELLEIYLDSLEGMVKKYPNQWFNFYDYWEDFEKQA
ncbi:MAG TPA: lysophospholipid acyltransferase family protein [Flavobacteriaceae bacterium]|nr:lysophospholipid acyltransferase family protein [Flavobacteriaceae bacterium]